jgi:hypothetical protein
MRRSHGFKDEAVFDGGPALLVPLLSRHATDHVVKKKYLFLRGVPHQQTTTSSPAALYPSEEEGVWF